MGFGDRSQISLDDLSLLKNQLEAAHSDFILNCGAYTAMDKAETEQGLADIVNYIAVKIIAQYSNDNQVKLNHISADYIFDGTSAVALTEEAVTQPINVCGASKKVYGVSMPDYNEGLKKCFEFKVVQSFELIKKI